ncbi:LETM1-related biofilm-associated protein [Flavobacterium sp.]|uniref:LETM1-related biofilm-associated protein n=1 Tax=Flavobacterium sp. TaxID=239 RepID=UPI002B4B8DCD|nr:LETM1-related biofilm-associated protein [Flavobacterium sp.]HLP64863.1 LETM1-related biofilm-associated protein [Flavobacterium sp.]
MINPSANGWIDKFFQEQGKLMTNNFTYELSLYKNIRKTGFIYGHVVEIDPSLTLDISHWKSDEISKVALLTHLYSMYLFTQNDSDFKIFVEKTIEFYNQLSPKGFDLFDKILSHSNSSKLESIIRERIQTNKDIISKNFSHIVTNALLFVDVLAFRQFLMTGKISNKYIKNIEEIILSVVTLALKVKTIKSQNDDLLIKLFESSVRYSKFSIDNEKSKNKVLESLDFDHLSADLEKYYILDLAGLTLWNDAVIENDELYFLHKLAEKISISDDFVNESVTDTDAFITKYKSEIQYFHYSNPVKHFYDQTTTGVQVLITRNKKRLTKEISESKELMQLLAKSTSKDLSPEEKKKVKKQILDICKSIPSLTIFLLPGGGLLLPILIKFIPQLLPSAFNENLED